MVIYLARCRNWERHKFDGHSLLRTCRAVSLLVVNCYIRTSSFMNV